MSGVKHTPGPWHHIPGSDKCGPYVTHDGQGDIADLYVVGNDPNRIYCHQGKEEAEANARLIAAAPDLLFALQGLLEAIGGEESTDIFCSAARAAITKATGEA